MSDTNLSSRLYPTRIDIPADARSEIVRLLNQSLAAILDLKTQVKQAHWNVKGTDFYQLHEMFDEMAEELEEYIDNIAERITALGGYAMGTTRMAAANSILPEYPVDALAGMEHVTALADRYAPFGKHVRQAIDTTTDLGDADTADLYTGLSRDIDKRLWFLEAHLQASTTNANGATATTSAPTAAEKVSV